MNEFKPKIKVKNNVTFTNKCFYFVLILNAKISLLRVSTKEGHYLDTNHLLAGFSYFLYNKNTGLYKLWIVWLKSIQIESKRIIHIYNIMEFTLWHHDAFIISLTVMHINLALGLNLDLKIPCYFNVVRNKLYVFVFPKSQHCMKSNLLFETNWPLDECKA